MKSGSYAKTICRLISCAMGLVALGPRVPCHGAVPEGILRYYQVKIELFSVQPDRLLDSYVSHGSGMATANATVQLACKDDLRDFSARIQARQKDNRFFAEITVAPDRSDTTTVGAAFRADFSALEPKAIELARNGDGRVYLLNLTPTVKIVDITPRRADETSFEFNKWVFHNSIVVVNDAFYVGKMNAGGGYKAYVDIADVGKFEFAMQPFRDAQLLGTLKDGIIRMECEDGTTVEIYDVKNGTHEMQLPGGPYAVWVRQTPSGRAEKYTVPPEAEWIEQVRGHYVRMGQAPPSGEELHRKYEQFKSRGPSATIAFGIGPIPEADKLE